MRTGISLVLDWENGIYSCTGTGIYPRGKGSKSKSQLMIYKEADRSLTMHLCPGLQVPAKIAIFRCLRKNAKIERLAIFES